MKHRISAFFIALVATFAMTAAAQSDRSNMLKVYNWADYLDLDLIEEFEQWYEEQTGEPVKVMYETFDINENMLTEIEIGHEDYDVVCPSEYIIERMLRKNLLQPINKEFPAGTPNWLGNVSPFAVDKFQQMATKPGMDVSDYAVGFMWGTTGILYNTRLVKPEEVESWDALYNPRFQERILMKDAFRDIYSVMVCYANYQNILDGKVTRDELVANITDENIFKVEDALFRAKKQIAGWEVDFGKERMTQEKAWINVTWSGDAMWAIEETAELGVELDYIVPKEGSNCWFDGWVIPVYAKNPKAASYWINFMCNSENAVRNMNEIGYVSVIGTEEVMDAMADDEIEEVYDLSYFFQGIEGADSLHINPVMYPDKSVIERCALMHDCADKNEDMLVMWSRVKGNSLDTEMLTFIIVVFTAIFAAIAWHHFKKWRKRKLRRLRLKEFTKKMHDKGRHI